MFEAFFHIQLCSRAFLYTFMICLVLYGLVRAQRLLAELFDYAKSPGPNGLISFESNARLKCLFWMAKSEQQCLASFLCGYKYPTLSSAIYVKQISANKYWLLPFSVSFFWKKARFELCFLFCKSMLTALNKLFCFTNFWPCFYTDSRERTGNNGIVIGHDRPGLIWSLMQALWHGHVY